MTESGATAPPGPHAGPGGAEPAGRPSAAAAGPEAAAAGAAAAPPGGPAEVAGVTAFWRDLGLPGLVDIHTHFMPPNVLAKVWAFFEGGRAGAGRPWPIAYRRPEEERVALLRAFGLR